jgi:hypothetical protein
MDIIDVIHKDNNNDEEKNKCVKKRTNYKEEIIYSQSRIIIFDTNVVKNKRLIGFKGSGCNVKICIGRIEIDCYDHEISCYLFHSHKHNIELLIQPYKNIMDTNVKLFWTDKYINNRFIIDETLNEILASVRYEDSFFGIQMLLQPFLYVNFYIREKCNTKFVKVAPILNENLDEEKTNI